MIPSDSSDKGPGANGSEKSARRSLTALSSVRYSSNSALSNGPLAGVRKFNEKAADKKNAAVLCISVDLPFAMQRFCTVEGIENVYPASAFRSPEFAEKYGVKLIDGPLKGLLARAVIILDENRNVIYRELVEEITNEPDYEAALKML